VKLADLAVYLAAFVRCAAFLTAFPLTGDKMVPARVRVALAALLALALAPSRRPEDLFATLPAEAILGFAAGFAARVVFGGVEAGGQLIGLTFGLGFAGTFDPSVSEEELPTRRLVRCLMGLAFFTGDGLPLTITALVRPPATAPTFAAAFRTVIDESARVMVVGVRLAAPAIIAALIANVAAGVAARAAPTLNFFAVSLSLILVVGAVVLLAAAPLTTAEIALAARRVVDVVGRALGIL
jgi:flagellar biosynthetic protein FliR